MIAASPAERHVFRRHADNGLAAYIFYSRYSRYRPDLGRRESFAEAVDRVEAMHREHFASRIERRVGSRPDLTPADPADHALLADLMGGATLGELIHRAFAAVAVRRVLPSMRSLQFGGEEILRQPARLFNCAFSPVDRLDFFREYFYLLLAGTGCGFSVQRPHLMLLPPLPAPSPGQAVRSHRVDDSIEGWARALDQLIRAYFEGTTAVFDFSAIRPRGSPMAAAGSVAPGPEPLRRALGEVAVLLRSAAGRRLRSIEIYDLCLLLSRAVLSGAGRRSASICLFSADDAEMREAKTGDWLRQHPQRAAANNSAVILRCEADERAYRRLFSAQRSHGEPGLYFADEPDYGCNPCGEAGLHPVITGPLDAAEIGRLRACGHSGALPPAARLSGWQLCNLTTINGALVLRPDDLFTAAIHAAVIGTLQAAYTDIPFLGPISRYLNERDALLGVSICGFMDNPGILLAPRVLERAARLCRAANELVAAALGIRPAARITCVKPEGTASLLLGAAPGIHAYPARRYFRRVQVARSDPVYRLFQQANPQMAEASALHPETDDCLCFPMEAPPETGLRPDASAVEFLQRVLLVQRHWIRSGEGDPTRSPGLHHNVSHTCPVRADEWEDVQAFIWRHRSEFSGITLIDEAALARYAQPPVSPVRTAEDVKRWNGLACRPVEYAAASAAPLPEAACAAGACEEP